MSSLAASAEVPEDIYSIWNALVQWLEKKHGMRDLHVVCEEMPGAFLRGCRAASGPARLCLSTLPPTSSVD